MYKNIWDGITWPSTHFIELEKRNLEFPTVGIFKFCVKSIFLLKNRLMRLIVTISGFSY